MSCWCGSRIGRASSEARRPDLPASKPTSGSSSPACAPPRNRFAAPLLVCHLPGIARVSNRESSSSRMEALVAAGLDGLSTVHLVRPREIDSLYPVAQRHDPLGDKLGHVPYTPAYFAALGTMLARKIHALRTPPFKAIALDCDDTLWRGICGEDGPQGVVVDAPRRALQEFMLAQHDAGMLLCLCSKNNVEDVLDTFRLHPEMRAAAGSFRFLAHQLVAQAGEPRRAGRGTRAGPRQLHPGGRQSQGVPRSGGELPGGAEPGAARATRTRFRISCATSGPSTTCA